MLTVQLPEFMMQLKDGAIHNIGPSTKTATVKLYDVERADGRAFGDERLKLEFEDEDGSVLEVAVFPEEIESLLADVESVRQAGTVEGFDPE